MMRNFLLTILILVIPSLGLSATSNPNFEILKAQNDVTDLESLKRGAVLFTQYCISCHSASLIRYSRIAEDLGWSKEEIANELLGGSTEKFTQEITSALTPEAGIAAYGIAPPDMTLLAKSKGVDYIYNYLQAYYVDQDGNNDNYIYPGTAMSPTFIMMQGWQDGVYEQGKDGKSELVAVKYRDEGKLDHIQIAEREFKFRNNMRDLVNFLDYISEPAQLKRFNLGYKVLLYVFFLIVLGFFLKRLYWKGIK